MKIIFSIIAVALVIGGIVFISQRGNNQPAESAPGAKSGTERALDPVPSIVVEDASGGDVGVTEYLGASAVVINSWATWCPFCVNELPDFVALQKEFPEDIKVIAVNRRESAGKGSNFLAELGIEDALVYLYDPTDAWYRAIGGFSMPETLFVNRQGEIVVHKRGFMALPEMREHIQKTLTSNL